MKFLTNWRINVDKIPSYVDFNHDWVTVADKELCRLLLESDDPRLTPMMKDFFQKTYDLIDPATNELKVLYRPRGGVGRRYPEEPSEFYTVQGERRANQNYKKYWGNLTIHSKYIKNTIFQFQSWRDYDQRKGHPTIIYEIAKRNGLTLDTYHDYIKDGGFETVCGEMIQWYSVEGEEPLTASDIKELFNKTIYGGGHAKWCDFITHENLDAKDREKLLRKGKKPKEMRNKNFYHPFYERFALETRFVTKKIWDANTELRNSVCAGMPDDSHLPFSRMRNKLMSQFCGILENELTFRAYKYRVDNGLCPAKKVDWGYDGFTSPCPPSHTDHTFHMNAMNEYVREKTGFSMVCFVEKEIKPDTVIWSVVEKRRNLVVAVPSHILVQGEPVDEPSIHTDDTQYLVWKAKFELEWCKIKNTASFLRVCNNPDGTFQKYIIQSEKQITTAYNHESFKKTIDGKSKKVKYILEWLADENMRSFDDADMYPPPLVCPPNIFNLWRPSPFADNWDYRNPETAYEFDEEGVQMFCDHLKILCNHEEVTYQYVSCWIAHMFQFPAEKSTHITLISEEGAGKSVLLETLSSLLGDSKVFTTSSPERDVWGSHNTLMINAFLVNLNEIDKRNCYNADGKIKNLITDPKLPINPKGKDQFPIKSYHRFISTTNSNDPTKTHSKDRRNQIVRSSDELVDNFAYFKKFTTRMSKVDTLRSIYACLMITDLTMYDFRVIPRTKYHKTIIENNRPMLELFMENFTIKNMEKQNIDLYGKEMFAQFRQWRDDNGYVYEDKMNEGVLIKRILLELKLLPDTIVHMARGSQGVKRRYDLVKLRQRFNIDEDCLGKVEGDFGDAEYEECDEEEDA